MIWYAYIIDTAKSSKKKMVTSNWHKGSSEKKKTNKQTIILFGGSYSKNSRYHNSYQSHGSKVVVY